jgi:hypothetical protein
LENRSRDFTTIEKITNIYTPSPTAHMHNPDARKVLERDIPKSIVSGERQRGEGSKKIDVGGPVKGREKAWPTECIFSLKFEVFMSASHSACP